MQEIFQMDLCLTALKSELSEIRNPQFEMIGFVEGHGNSNSPKDYLSTDN
jgi:hypothetical protein